MLLRLPLAAIAAVRNGELQGLVGGRWPVCLAGARSSGLHPPHDQARCVLWPTHVLALGLGGAIYGRVAGSMLGGCCPSGREQG
jgi:hypothetical protein